MAAIPTIYQGGNGLTGFTTVAGAVSEDVNGIAASNPGVTSAVDYDTPYAETTNPDVGIHFKWTLGGGLQRGSKMRFKFDIVDSSNYKYIEITFGGIQLFSDLFNDDVTLWEVVAGVPTNITGDTPLRYLQQTVGDLRHWSLVEGSDISVIRVGTQILVSFSGHDTLYGYDWNTDIILLRETHAALTTNGKMGVEFVGGSHTNLCTKMQAGTIRAFYTAGDTGNDVNSGTEASPFATINKLWETVDTNQIGFVKAKTGGYVESVIAVGFNYKGQSAVSYEDGVRLVTFGTDSIVQESNSSNGVWYLKGDNTVSGLRFYTWCGNWKWDAKNTDDCQKLWGQSPGDTDKVHKYCRTQEIFGDNAGGGAAFAAQYGIFYNGTPPYDSPPTPASYEQYHHWLDCRAEHSNNLEPEPQVNNTHGFYLNAHYLTVDYPQSQFHRGAVGKFAHGTADGPYGLGVQVVDKCRVNFMYAYRCGFGWNMERGSNYATGCFVEESGYRENGTVWGENIASAYGFMMGLQANDSRCIACIALNCYYAGFMIEGAFGDVTNCKVINCTAYGNHYNYTVRTNSSYAVTGTLFLNDSAYAFTNRWSTDAKDYQRTIISGSGDTGTTFTTNHETSNTGFGGAGGVYGDPLFENPGAKLFTPQAGSPLIGAGSDASAYFTKDFERKPLPQGSWHIGALAPENSIGSSLPSIRRYRSRSFPKMNVFA